MDQLFVHYKLTILQITTILKHMIYIYYSLWRPKGMKKKWNKIKYKIKRLENEKMKMISRYSAKGQQMWTQQIFVGK